MDFHTLTRRELQALCKMNKIPANITNVAMANALKALEFVEGIDEVMNPSEAANSSVESPEKSDIMSTAPRTSRRTAFRTIAKKEPEMSQTVTRTRRSTRRNPPQNLDEVKNEVIETPAAPTARRRAAATSVHSKMESLLKECVDKEEDGEQILNEKKDIPKTPGAGLTSRRREVKENTSVRQVYSTRRSARLASKYEDSSKQDTEMSQTVTFDSFTDETDEILDVNSKLCSLHLDDEQGKPAGDPSASNGNENQNVASKELNIDMHQSSEVYAAEEITNELIENYATVDFSAGKVSNDVEVDLQQGADLLLEGQEVVCDNMAGEVSGFVVENAGAICGDEMVEDDSHFKGEDEGNIDEISDHAVEDDDVQPKDHGNEISQWEVINVDAQVLSDNTTQCKHLDEELAVDEMIPLSKQLDEEDKANNTNGISDIEFKCQEVVISEQLGAEDACNEELDTKENFECEVEDHGMVLDDKENSSSDFEDLHCKGQEIGDNMALPNQPVNEDEQFNDEGQCMNDEISEQDASQEKIVNPASKDVVDAPVLPLASSLPHAHVPNFTMMLDPAHISFGVAPLEEKKPSDKTPREQSIGKTMAATTNMGVNHVSDDKENSGINVVLTKEKLKKKGNAEMKNQKPLEDLSLRQLTKMMKELKIQIAEKSTKAVSRPALQQVPENCLVGESRNGSED